MSPLRLSLKLAKGRVRTARLLTRGLLGKVSGRMPSNNISSLEEALWRPNVSRHVLGATKISSACTVKYDFPESYPPQFRRSKAFDKKVVYTLEDVFRSPCMDTLQTPVLLLCVQLKESAQTILDRLEQSVEIKSFSGKLILFSRKRLGIT